MNLTKIEINAQFAKALAAMEEGGRHLFITGKAGTGKSTLLEYFREHTKRDMVVLAPTGVAAVNVGGQTIHSFFRFKPDITIEKARKNAEKVSRLPAAKLYRAIESIVIDEVSMVRADLLDCMDAFLRVVRLRKGAVFGGASVVMIGDLYQLPPVVTTADREHFAARYKSPYFFSANVYPAMDVEMVELDKIYRQRDEDFIRLLNAVRNNTIDAEMLALLNSRHNACDHKDAEGAVHLTSLNREADAINSARLSELKGRARHYTADVDGDFDAKSYPADPELVLKKGAQVMLLNNDQGCRWVNGTMGVVTDVSDDGVSVRLEDGAVEDVGPVTWEMFRFIYDRSKKAVSSETVGSFTQIPLMLAWAVTIHKSQGKTFDRAMIDLKSAFAHGQAYVALSRLRSFDGMFLKNPVKKGHVRVDWRVADFLTKHSYAISEKLCPLDEKLSLIEGAIAKKAMLELTYLKRDDTKSKRVVLPLEVGEMEYLDRPFIGMRGRCTLRGDERVFRVDRILEMKMVE